MAAKRLTERFSFEGGRVGGSADAPVIEGVLLCGPTSANRRRYLTKAFEGGRVQRYNGAPVNLNHGKGPDGRPYQEQIGIVQNARLRSDGMPVGDIAVNPKKPYAEAFLWDAKHQPKACGMSHVAHCETTAGKDGWDDVTELVRVESVDVISAGNAATTRGLYENRGSAVAKISLKVFVERYGPKWGPKKWSAAAKLCEDMGAVADAPVMDEPPADDAGEGDLKTALMNALAPILDEAFESGNSEKACSALRDFIKMHAKHTGKGDAGGGKSEPEPEPEEESTKRPTNAAVLAECAAKAFNPTAVDLCILSEIASPATRATYIESHAKANPSGHRPTGTSRRPGAGSAGNQPVKESTTAQKPAAIPKFDDL